MDGLSITMIIDICKIIIDIFILIFVLSFVINVPDYLERIAIALEKIAGLENEKDKLDMDKQCIKI